MRYIVLLSLFLSSLVSCSKEDNTSTNLSDEGITIEVSASHEEGAASTTRVVTLDYGNGLYGYAWRPWDEIGVYTTSSSSPITFYVKEGTLTTYDSEGQLYGTTAIFQGVIPDSYASDGVVYATYPSIYTETKTSEYGFSVEEQVCTEYPNAANSLFLAKSNLQDGNITDYFDFEQQCALLRFKLNLPSGSTIKSTDDLTILVTSEQLAVECEFDFSKSGDDRITERTTGTHTLTLSGDKSGESYIEFVMSAIPTSGADNLTDLEVVVKDKYSNGLFKYANAFSNTTGGEEIEANYIYTLEGTLVQQDVIDGEDEDSPIKITTKQQLFDLATEVNSGITYEDTYFRLDKNIDLEGDSWTPIGTTSSNSFKGYFNGNSKTISGFSITEMSGNAVGLFGFVTGGYIKDVTVDGEINVTNGTESAATYTGDCHIGAIAGYLENVSIEGNIISLVDIEYHNVATANSLNVGGLFGNFVSSTYLDLSSDAFLSYGTDSDIPDGIKVYAANHIKVGGVVGIVNGGTLNEGAKMECRCKEIYAIFDGTVARTALVPSMSIGGLVGRNNNSWLKNVEGTLYDSCELIHGVSSASASILQYVYVGGLVGQSNSAGGFDTAMSVSMTTMLRSEISNDNGDNSTDSSAAYVGRLMGYHGTNTTTYNKFGGVLITSPGYEEALIYAGGAGACYIAGTKQ